MNPYFILFFFFFFFFFFSLPFHFLFAIGPQQTTPPLSAIATAAGRFRFRFMCPIVAGIRGRTRSYDPYGEEGGESDATGFSYITIFHGETIRKVGGATHMRAGQAGNGGERNGENTTHLTHHYREKRSCPKMITITLQEFWSGLIGFFFFFCCYFFFFCSLPPLLRWPARLRVQKGID